MNRFRVSCTNRANDGKNRGHQMYLTFVTIPWVDLSMVVVSLRCFILAFVDLNLGDTYSVSFNLLSDVEDVAEHQSCTLAHCFIVFAGFLGDPWEKRAHHDIR